MQQELGWADWQVRTDRAIRRHWALVCAACSCCWWAWRRAPAVAAAPVGTPAPVIARANAALNKVLQLPELGERLARLGYAPRGSEPEYFRSFLREQIETLTARAKEAGLEQQ
jgi:hypothetical protein